MKFTLVTSNWFYSDEADEHRLGLEKLGFPFDKSDNKLWKKTSGSGVPIEFDTLEELAAFTKKWGMCKLYDHYLEIWDAEDE